MKSALALALSLALTGPAWAKGEADTITVATPSQRSTITRILIADNLDTASMVPSDVLAHIQTIQQGNAPDDFWLAYQAHVYA